MRCNQKRAKHNSGARSQDQGFAHFSLPFVSTFEVLFVGGNNHLGAKGLFVVGRLLNMPDKEAMRRVLPATLRNTRLQRARHVVAIVKALGIGRASVDLVL